MTERGEGQSTLAAIQELEGQVAARVRAASAAREERLDAARCAVARRLEEARQEGEHQAARRYESGLRAARAEAAETRAAAQHAAEELRRDTARIARLTDAFLELVLPSGEG